MSSADDSNPAGSSDFSTEPAGAASFLAGAVRNRRFLGVSVVVLLVAGSAAAYQVGIRSQRPPSFRRGGAFAAAGPAAVTIPPTAPPTTTAANADPPPRAYDPAVTATTALSPTTIATPTTVVTRTQPTSATTTTAPVRSLSVRPLVPAFGTYTWAVSGSERATGFGSRAFPSHMTTVLHGAQDPREVVADFSYSADHTEREILGYRDGGVFLDFEGGQVRFGAASQTNQGDYRPPIPFVPTDLGPGAVLHGASRSLAGDGSVQRTEDWTVTVAGTETLTVDGRPTATWKITVDRTSRPGSAQQITTRRTLWWDPDRLIWVRLAETMHGRQTMLGIPFDYDRSLTATLVSAP